MSYDLGKAPNIQIYPHCLHLDAAFLFSFEMISNFILLCLPKLRGGLQNHPPGGARVVSRGALTEPLEGVRVGVPDGQEGLHKLARTRDMVRRGKAEMCVGSECVGGCE